MAVNVLKRCGIVVLFILFPTFTLPIVFVEIYNKKTYSLLLLAIYMGLLSIYYFPWGDQYRYMNNLINYSSQDCYDVFDFNRVLIFRDLNLVNLLLFCYSKCLNTIELFRFLMVVSSFLLIFKIFKDVDTGIVWKRKRRFIFFLLLFFSVPFYHICYGYRTGIAICLFCYGYYRLWKGEVMCAYFYMLLAGFTHYIFFIELICCFISFNLKFTITRKTLLWLVIAFPLLFYVLLSLLYGKIAFVDLLIDFYIRGEYGLENDKSIRDIMSSLFLNGFIVLILDSYFLLNNRKGKYENLLYINICLLIISIPFSTINERILALSVLLNIVYYITHMSITNLSKLVVAILPILFFSFIYPYWKHRDIYALTQISEIVYKPLPLILQHTVPEKEVNKYIDFNGEYVK